MAGKASGAPLDQAAAVALQELFGDHLPSVPGLHKHSVLGTLLKRGQLEEFMDELLSLSSAEILPIRGVGKPRIPPTTAGSHFQA